MVTLSKRATPSQKQILRIVEGAVKNVSDCHTYITPQTARSIAKRAAGTLSAQWLRVLAATPEQAEETFVISQSQRTHPCKSSGRSSLSMTQGRAPLNRLIKELSKRTGEAKRANQPERASTLIEVLRIIHGLAQ